MKSVALNPQAIWGDLTRHGGYKVGKLTALPTTVPPRSGLIATLLLAAPQA
jgi:hypothetical protein